MTQTTRAGVGRPLVIAHRGASADAPENTIAAFELALAQGADAIELDVHLSRDDHPVVIHDWTLERTTDGAGPVRDRSVRELKRLDAGGWRGPAFAGQRIQTLQEVLERFGGRGRLVVELKGGSGLYPGIEERVVSTLEIYAALGRTLLQSFDHAALGRLRTLSPEVRLGALIAEAPGGGTPAGPGVIQAMCPAVHAVTGADVAAWRQSGLECYVWTVNEPALMDRLISWGVTGIITDHPALLRSRL
jgi:glycerophosphoryl diester phosphodiesterase